MHDHNECNHKIKLCGKCKQILSLDSFGKNKRGKYGLSSICKECRRTNPIRKCKYCDTVFNVMHDGARHEFCSKVCATKYNIKSNNFRLLENGKRHRYWIKTRYNLEDSEYDDMMFNQNGCCAICGERRDVLFVDHNHITKKVRKLLCRQCNGLLGLAHENIYVLQNAINYLEEENA